MELKVNSNPEVESVFAAYPDPVREKMRDLRTLILETARGMEGISALEEALKWGEPSYLAKQGSTLRIDWKSRAPGQYAMYFKCTSRLVETFRAVHGDLFSYEGNRAIVFQMEDELPVDELRSCIGAALSYHRVKHLPDLGIQRFKEQ